ncbi:hypothetical protein [Cesiribacter andamanensis]|uniref:Cardiolipin synthase N-terminal domain-containing protein n=1 Tax=Cesiribacter andamanensis AMV16 TaxID=1279009 RepID=M7N2W0_9BACT|nr:hypothetical protein [Cesiribacter andamanensis]EMR01627.1 hypothetical protein ADICEAN_03249 [Cesiribacter andamanensis AMV16]
MESSGLSGLTLLLVVILGVAFLGLYIWSIVWAYNDAKIRNQHPVLVAIMVALLSWPLGLVIWLIVRR